MTRILCNLLFDFFIALCACVLVFVRSCVYKYTRSFCVRVRACVCEIGINASRRIGLKARDLWQIVRQNSDSDLVFCAGFLGRKIRSNNLVDRINLKSCYTIVLKKTYSNNPGPVMTHSVNITRVSHARSPDRIMRHVRIMLTVFHRPSATPIKIQATDPIMWRTP